MAIDLVPIWTLILGLAVFYYVVFDGFDLGVGILSGLVSPEWRRLMMNSACSTGVPDQAAFHSVLLPASESDRAVVGPHAQKRHAQQMLRNMRPIRRCEAQFPA